MHYHAVVNLSVIVDSRYDVVQLANLAHVPILAPIR